MKRKITDLKIEQVPCKKAGFKEFKITYKYKGKLITDFKTYDVEMCKGKLDHELYREVANETNKRYASGELVKYAHKFTGFTKALTIACVTGGIAVATAVIVPTTLILTAPTPVEPEPEPLPDWRLFEPLTFTAETNNLTLYINKSEDIGSINLERSYDKENWETVDVSKVAPEKNEVATLTKGNKVYFKGNNPNGFSNNGVHYTFAVDDSNHQFSVMGNVMSLISATKYSELNVLPCDWCFDRLFIKALNQTPLIDAKDLVLPALKVEHDEYNRMFENQENLKNGPYIMATQLSSDNEEHCTTMFSGCSQIKTINVDFDESVWEKNPNATFNWCAGDNFPVSGTFYWKGSADYDLRDKHHIPEGWTIVHKD